MVHRPRGGAPGVGCAFAFALLWLALLGAFDALIAYQLHRERDARRRFVPVEAQVLVSEVEVHEDAEGGTTYSPRIEYRYAAGGREHVGTRYAYSAWSTSDHDDAAETVARFPTGATITVRYDPDDPAESVIDVSGRAFPRLIFLFLLPFHCVGVGLLAIAITSARTRRLGERERLTRKFVAETSERRTIVRAPRLAPWMTSVCALGAASFVSVFAVALSQGFRASDAALRNAVAASLGVALAAGLWQRRRRVRPGDRLLVDHALGTFAFPADAPGARIQDMGDLTLRSRPTSTTVNGVRVLAHEVTTDVRGETLPVFAFRGSEDEGGQVLDLLRDLVRAGG